MLGLFVGLAEVELAIARGRYKNILRLKHGSPITLVDKLYPIGFESTIPRRFNIELVTDNVYDFLSRSPTQQYQIVTINAVEHHLNDHTEEGIDNTAYLRMVLPNFVKQNGLVLAHYDKAINLLDDRKTWIPLKSEYGAAFIRK